MTETIAQIADISIEQLWDSAPTSELIFIPDSLTHLPEAARRLALLQVKLFYLP